MRQRRFAATGCAGDDIERKLRDSAAENVVQTAHARGHFADDYFSRLTRRSVWHLAFGRVIALIHG